MKWYINPELVETAVVKLTMDGEAYDRLKDDIESMGIVVGRVEKYDTVDIEYSFTVEYYSIVATLKSLIILLNDPSVSAAMIGSKDNLNLLFVDLVDTVRKAQKMLNEKISQ